MILLRKEKVLYNYHHREYFIKDERVAALNRILEAPEIRKMVSCWVTFDHEVEKCTRFYGVVSKKSCARRLYTRVVPFKSTFRCSEKLTSIVIQQNNKRTLRAACSKALQAISQTSPKFVWPVDWAWLSTSLWPLRGVPHTRHLRENPARSVYCRFCWNKKGSFVGL